MGGASKMLLAADGGTLLARVARRLLDAPLDRVVVVLGHDAERVRRDAALPEDERLVCVVNDRWAEGMATSLVAGLRACADAEAVLVALGDQPEVEPSVVEKLVAAWRQGAALALPAHGGRASHPVLFDRRLFPELLALGGDVGARAVVKRHLAEAAIVEGEPLRDLDTPADYDAWRAGEPGPGKGGFELS